MSDFFVVAVWLILRKCCHFKRMHWSSAPILYVQLAVSAIGYLPRRAFWHNFCVNLSIQTILQRELNICARSEARVCALQVSPVHARYQHPGDDGINDSSYSSIRHSHWTRVNGLSTFFFFIAVVVMYWESRMRIHQQKHTLAKPCFF